MDELLEQTIIQIKKELDEMTLSNISIKRKSFKQYDKILTALEKLNDKKEERFEIKKEEAVIYPEQEEELVFEDEAEDNVTSYTIDTKDTEEIEEEKEDIDELASIFDDKKELIGYPFSRKLSGGFLIKGTPSENIFVPESIIRELDIEEGDIVSAETIEGASYSTPTYYFNIVEKNNKPVDTKRIEFNYAIVNYDTTSNRFVISENMNKESLRINNGDIMTYIVKDREATHFGLLHGDIVDIAWYEGNFDKAKITWKHPIEEPKKTESKKIIKHKKENNSNKTKEDEDGLEQTLKGKRVCLIGLEPFWDNYKKAVAERGGELDCVEPERHKTSMSASIRKSDLVIVGISHISHDASIYANTRSKHYNIPFTSVKGFGTKSFINEVENKLNIT